MLWRADFVSVVDVGRLPARRASGTPFHRRARHRAHRLAWRACASGRLALCPHSHRAAGAARKVGAWYQGRSPLRGLRHDRQFQHLWPAPPQPAALADARCGRTALRPAARGRSGPSRVVHAAGRQPGQARCAPPHARGEGAAVRPHAGPAGPHRTGQGAHPARCRPVAVSHRLLAAALRRVALSWRAAVERGPLPSAPSLHRTACRLRAKGSLGHPLLRALGRPEPRQIRPHGADRAPQQRHLGLQLRRLRPLDYAARLLRHQPSDKLLLHGALGHEVPLFRRGHLRLPRAQHHHEQRGV